MKLYIQKHILECLTSGALTLLSNNLLAVWLGPSVWHWLEAAGADEMAALRGAAVLVRSYRQDKCRKIFETGGRPEDLHSCLS